VRVKREGGVGEAGEGKVDEREEADALPEGEDEDDEAGAPRGKTKGFSLVFDVVRRFAQPLGIDLPRWEGRVIETKKGVVRLMAVPERAKQLFGEDGVRAAADWMDEEPAKPVQLRLFPEEQLPPTLPIRGRKRGKVMRDLPAEGAVQAGATTLDVIIRQDGTDYSSRIVSEGTLRVLALCAIAVNPWGGSLLAFEEPENGVHPRRLELIANLLLSLALPQGRQVIVTTHSPLFCDAVLKGAGSYRNDIGLFNVRREAQATVVQSFDITGPLFKDQEIAAALTAGTEDGLFENLLLRGMIDE